MPQRESGRVLYSPYGQAWWLKVSVKVKHRIARLVGGRGIIGNSDATSALQVPCVFIIVFFLLVLPILLFSYPPLVDMPNHLAYHYIQAVVKGHLDHSHLDDIKNYYDLRWFVPYHASDALYLPLTKFVSIYNAEKVVLATIVFMWLLAPIILHRVLWGRYSIWPIFSAMVVFNANLAFGFENYVLSVPLAILAFCLWIIWARQESAVRLGCFAIIATALFFAHLLAFGLLSILVGSYEFGILFDQHRSTIRARISRMLVCCLPFVPGALLLVSMLLQSSERYGFNTSGAGTFFGGISDRLLVLTSPVLEFGGIRVKVMSAVTLLILVLILYGGFRTKAWLKLHHQMRTVLLVLVVIALVTPAKLLGEILLQIRLPVVIVVLFIGSTRWDNLPWRAAMGIIVTTGTVLVVSTVVRVDGWYKFNNETKELVAAFGMLPHGTKLLVATNQRAAPPLYWDIAAYAVIERQVFLPSLFTGGLTNLRVQPKFRRIDAPAPPPVPVILLLWALHHATRKSQAAPKQYWETWWKDFNNILVLGRRSDNNPAPGLLKAIHKGSYFTLYHNKAIGHS